MVVEGCSGLGWTGLVRVNGWGRVWDDVRTSETGDPGRWVEDQDWAER